MSDGLFHTGGARGINDWYLDRQGRGDSAGDDDRADRGPDVWLDRVTGPSAPRGKKAVVGANRQNSRGVSAQRLGWTRGSHIPLTPALRPTRSPQPLPGASDVDLARAAAALQRLSSRPLTPTDVVRRLRAAGWRITDADLERAIRATKTGQRTQTANGKATTPSAPRPPIPTPTAASPGRATVSPVVRAERNLGKTKPKPSSAEASRGEITRRPVDDAERVAMQTTSKMSKWKVASRALKQGLPSRAESDTTAKATRWDRHLAREVASMRSKSTQKLSDSEVVRRLRSAGWQVTEANLQRAIRPITIKRAKPYRRSQGEPAKSGKPSRRPPSMEVRIDNSICDACGAAVSANGYCGCS